MKNTSSHQSKIYPKDIAMEMADISKEELKNCQDKDFVVPKVTKNGTFYSLDDVEALRIATLLDRKFEKTHKKIQFLLSLIENNNLSLCRIAGELEELKDFKFT